MHASVGPGSESFRGDLAGPTPTWMSGKRTSSYRFIYFLYLQSWFESWERIYKTRRIVHLHSPVSANLCSDEDTISRGIRLEQFSVCRYSANVPLNQSVIGSHWQFRLQPAMCEDISLEIRLCTQGRPPTFTSKRVTPSPFDVKVDGHPFAGAANCHDQRRTRTRTSSCFRVNIRQGTVQVEPFLWVVEPWMVVTALGF